MYLYSSLFKIFCRTSIFERLVFCLIISLTPLQAFADSGQIKYSCTLPFSNGISPKEAQIIAKSFGYTQALIEVQDSLKKHKAISFGLQDANLSLSISAELYKLNIETKPIDPAAVTGDVTIIINLIPKSHNIEQSVGSLLSKHDLLELRLELLDLLVDYALKGHKLMLIHAGIQKSAQSLSKNDVRESLLNISRHLEALWLYNTALNHFHETWENPTLVQELLKDATTLAPSMSALWAAIGEVQLQMDQPQTALQNLNHALALQPERSRTYYVRGLGHLRLHQPALAMTDLDTALMYKPQMVSWLRARGAIALVLEEYDIMCADFEKACALGDCEGLMHAREREFCLK